MRNIASLMIAGFIILFTGISPLQAENDQETGPLAISELEQEISNPEGIIHSVQFYDYQGQSLKSLKNRSYHLYGDEKPIEVQITGKIFDYNGDHLLLSIFPILEQKELKIEHLSDQEFQASFFLEELPFNIPLQLTFSIPNYQNDRLSELSIIPLTLHPADDHPTTIKNILQEVFDQKGFIFLFIFLMTAFIVLRGFSQHSKSKKVLALLLITAEITFLLWNKATDMYEEYLQKGVISSPTHEKVIQQSEAYQAAQITLTQLNDNLSVVPGLSTRWSNIRPQVWEFVIRENQQGPLLSASEIAKHLKNEHEKGLIYLRDISQIIAINNQRLQFITKYPDPLLPQKLARVDLKPIAYHIQGFVLPYQLKNASVDLILEEQNKNYYDSAFSKSKEPYKTIFIDSQTSIQKDRLDQEAIDLIKEPSPAIWPTLFLKEFQILPAINTETVLLITNRNHPSFKESQNILQFKNLLHTGAILQTSYFQYGQLANQFAPPGVVGYSPDIENESKEVPDHFSFNGETLSFHYPREEEALAKAIINLLEKYEAELEISTFSSKDIEKHLETNEADLVLVSLQFELGDIGPFLDTLVHSQSPLNNSYKNERVDELINQSRRELNRYNRLELLQELMHIIVVDDPIGIPLLFKRSFIAERKEDPSPWYQQWLETE